MTIQQLLLGTPAASGIVTSGLVLHLDAGNPSSYPGTGTAWTDLSGSGNNGTLYGGFGYNSADGGQITFNGSNSAAVCGNAASLQNNSASVEVWFKASNTNSSYRGLFGKEQAQMLLVKDNVLIAYDWGNVAERSTGVNVGDNVWRQAVLTVSGTGSNNSVIYINGTLSLTTTIAVLGQGFNVTVGQNAGIQWLNGSVAISRFYNRALSAAEITQNFNANRARFGL